MNTLSRAMLKTLRSYELTGTLAADFRTVKSLLGAGFIEWDSTRSCYAPSDLGMQALDDHDAANEPDPDVLGWLIASAQVEEEPDDEPEPAQVEPVVVAAQPKPKRTREPQAATG